MLLRIRGNDGQVREVLALRGEKGDPGVPGCVTPEMFGAAGDGMADDTEALRKCIATGLPICATKKYKITEQLNCTKSLMLYGGGEFYGQSADEKYSMFHVGIKNGECIDSFVVRDISFSSVRDNTNVYPPRDHVRPDGSLSSNVTFLDLYNVDNVFVQNVRFDNSEYDICCDGCGDVRVVGFSSNNASMFTYFQRCKNVMFRDGNVNLYDLAGNGDHHFYVCYGNGDVLIENVKMFSDTVNSASYPIHVGASSERGQTPYTETVVVRGCYIEHNTLACPDCINGLVFEDTELVFINPTTTETITLIFTEDSGMDLGVGVHAFRNCRFSRKHAGANAPQLRTQRKVLFDNCELDYRPSINASADITFRNSTLCGGTESIYVSSNAQHQILFENCRFIQESGYCVYIGKPVDAVFLNCNWSGGATPVSNRSSATLTAIGCSGACTDSYFNYDGSVSSATYKLYNCVFPNLKLHDNGQVFEKHNCVFAE